MISSAAERELHSQRASQAAEEITAFNQIEAAQLDLAHSQDALDQGLNGEVNAGIFRKSFEHASMLRVILM